MIERVSKGDQDYEVDSQRRKAKVQNRNAIALFVAANLASVATAEAQVIFKCKDAKGNVTYTEVPCLRSETSAVVDTRSNDADFTSIRKEVGRLQALPPPAPAQSSSSEPPPPPPAPSPAPAPRPGY